MIRYETKDVQPPADILNKLAKLLNTSVDYLIDRDSTEKAVSSLKNAELLQQFKEVEKMNNEDKKTIKNIIDAFIKRSKLNQIALL